MIRSAPTGVISSLISSLMTSAIGWISPKGPSRFGPKRSWKRATTFRSTHTSRMSTINRKLASTTTPNTVRITVTRLAGSPKAVNQPDNQFAIALIGSPIPLLLSFRDYPGGHRTKRLREVLLQPFEIFNSYSLHPFQYAFTPGINQADEQDEDKYNAFSDSEQGDLLEWN